MGWSSPRAAAASSSLCFRSSTSASLSLFASILSTSRSSVLLFCLLCTVVCLPSLLPLAAAQSCNPCTPGGCGAVDFSSLTSEYNVAGGLGDGRTYAFMLCADDAKCSGQVCEQSRYEGTSSLGTHATATWTPNSASGDASQGAVLSVSGGSEGYECKGTASATVNVTCGTGDESISIPTEGGYQGCKWAFIYNSKYVCGLPKSGGGGAGKGGLSGGSIFLILFFVGAFVYFVGGVLFMKYRRGASGADLIPNVGFWRDLPGLVRDGCVFSFNKARALCGGARTGSLASKGTGSTYETI